MTGISNTKYLQLDNADFTPGDLSLTFFHGPTIQIMGKHFHSFAFAVVDNDGLQEVENEEDCGDKMDAMQSLYEGFYETIEIHGKPCVLVIHPFSE